MDRRALLWVSAAVGVGVLAVVVVFGLVENAHIASVIGGADVHLTRPVLDALPRPPGTKLFDERPGLADTESISQDFTAQDLNSIVRFSKGAYIPSVAVDPSSTGYTLTVQPDGQVRPGRAARLNVARPS